MLLAWECSLIISAEIAVIFLGGNLSEHIFRCEFISDKICGKMYITNLSIFNHQSVNFFNNLF